MELGSGDQRAFGGHRRFFGPAGVTVVGEGAAVDGHGGTPQERVQENFPLMTGFCKSMVGDGQVEGCYNCAGLV